MQDILTIIDKFDASSLTELEYSDGSAKLLLKKEDTAKTGARARKNVSPALTQAELNQAMELPPLKTNATVITSPMVATFYASPGPDSPSFVSKGKRVQKGQTLCTLEAMKMMNQLEAEFDCIILDIKVNSGELVEFGQPLFEVERV